MDPEIPEGPQNSFHLTAENRFLAALWQKHVSAITIDTITLQNCLQNSDPRETGQGRVQGGFLGHSADAGARGSKGGLEFAGRKPSPFRGILFL